jgi:hypothetical protein
MVCVAGRRRRGPHFDRRQAMARCEQHSNRESKKPKKEKPKAIAAAPSITRVADLSGQSNQLQKH